MTSKEKAAQLIGEENLKILENNGFVIKPKHVHRTHQTNRYAYGEKEIIGYVVQREVDVIYPIVDKDINGFEIITNDNTRYIFTQWVSNQNYIEVKE